MGQILADLGAEVIKVERRDIGDETRQWGPPFVVDKAGEALFSAYFQACNRGKRSVEADFATEEGRALVLRLAAGADIVVENFKVGALARHGLDAQAICHANPRLIWCAITGFGQTGPYAARPGYDYIIQAMSGLLTLNGLDLAQPLRVPLPTSDLFTGLYGAVAVLAVLNRRHETGRGAILDLSLFDTQISTLSQYIVGHAVEPRTGPCNPHATVVPQFIVPTSDGSVALVLASDLHFWHLIEGIGLSDLAEDIRFRDKASRCAHLEALVAVLSDATQRLGTQDFLERMEKLGVPAGRVNSLADAVCDPQLRERAMLIRIPGPTGGSGNEPAVRMPVLFDGVAAETDRGAPRLGEHNDEIEADSGWSPLRPSDRH